MGKKQNMFVEDLMCRINSGEFPNGTFLPSERDLALEYQVSRITIRAGLKQLLEKHLLQTESTKGYRVLHIPGMPSDTTPNIGALFCDSNFSLHSHRLYDAAGEQAAIFGYTLFVRECCDDAARQAAELSQLLEENIAGMLLIPTFSPATHMMTLGNHKLMLALRRSGIPLVLMDRDFPETDLSAVLNDEYAGGVLVAEHFAALGHKKVVFLYSGVSYYISHRRFSGFQDRCAQLGIEVEKITLFSDSDDSDYFVSQAALCDEYFKQKEKLRNLVVQSKATAVLLCDLGPDIGFYQDLKDLDLDFVIYNFPPLQKNGKGRVWYVKRPLEDISTKAMQMLLAEIKTGAKAPVRQLRLEPEIIQVS